MTVKEFAEKLGCHLITVYRWLESGRLKANKNWRGEWQIEESELIKLKGGDNDN